MIDEFRVNPEMIVLAREVRGLSQVDLAKGINSSQPTISRYEAGTADVPSEHLNAIAAFLERPKAFFFWKDPLYSASCMYHRKNRKISVADLRVIHAKVNLLRIQAFKLLKSANIKSKYAFHRLDSSKYGGPQGCAKELRRLWQLPLGPISNVVRSIERAGGIVFRCPFGVARVDGISQWILEDDRTPPVFFVHDEIPGDRQRWTLAHEIGHVVMHHMPSDDPEGEANTFASEFMMPADEIESDLGNMTLPKAAALKGYWKVSMASIIVRAFQLKKISEPQYKYLFQQIGIRGYKKQEPVIVESETPNMFRDILGFYRMSLRKGAKEVADLLGESEQGFMSEHGASFSTFRLVG